MLLPLVSLLARGGWRQWCARALAAYKVLNTTHSMGLTRAAAGCNLPVATQPDS